MTDERLYFLACTTKLGLLALQFILANAAMSTAPLLASLFLGVTLFQIIRYLTLPLRPEALSKRIKVAGYIRDLDNIDAD